MNMMDPYALTGSIAVTLLLLLVTWQGFRTWQIRINSRANVEYRVLAQENIVAQQQTVTELAELRIRVVNIEKMLREVE